MKEPQQSPFTYNILLLESDPQETEFYSNLIREVCSCKIDVMSNLDNSFDWLNRSNYHLIVLDGSYQREELQKERRDLLGMLELIKRLSPFTSVILLSDRADIEEAVSAIRLGAEDYLQKPFSPETFKLAVKRGLDRKVVFERDTDVSRFLNLLTSCQMISATLEKEKIFKIIQSYFSMELNSHYSAIYTWNANEGGKRAKISSLNQGDEAEQAAEEVLDIAVYATGPFKKLSETDSEIFRFIDRSQLTPGLFIFKFRCVDDFDYYCICLSPTRPADPEAFENRLHMLKTQIEVTGKNIKQYMGVRNLAFVDDVTGLYNTRYLNKLLDRVIRSANESDQPFSVLFIDVDHFKQVNDKHGHLVGSKLLSELGRVLQKFVRESDNVFRYGGDEFVAVLYPCDLETAKMVAERFRKSIEKRKFLARDKLDLQITISIGVALFPDHAKTQKEIIQVADKVMYSAKKVRNSVYIAESKTDKKPEK